MCSTKILKYYHKNVLNGHSSQLTTYLGGIIMPLKHLILVNCYRGNWAYLWYVRCPALILICHLTLCKFHVIPNHLQLFCLFLPVFHGQLPERLWLHHKSEVYSLLVVSTVCFIWTEQKAYNPSCMLDTKKVGLYTIQCWGCPRSETYCKCCSNNQRMQQEVLGFSGKLNLRLLFVTLLSW